MNVSNEFDQVNPTSDDTVEWLGQMADKGVWKADSARQCRTALKKITSVMGEDEDRHSRAVLADLESLGSRYANKTGRPDTARTYVSKARRALEDHLRFIDAPLKYKPKERPSSPGRKAASDTKTKKKTRKGTPPPDAPPAAEEGYLRGQFPVATGKLFSYTLPAEGLTRNDVERIARHLATFCGELTDPAWQRESKSTELAQLD